MDIQISDRRKLKFKWFIISPPILILLIVITYLIYTYIPTKDEDIEVDNTKVVAENEDTKLETDLEEEEIEETGPHFEEIFPVIQEQQAYVVVPSNLEVDNPPVLIIYSHGSNTLVTQNMEDQFMKDLQSYGIYFTQHNYIFSASNQHGVNWGNTASIQDTLNLKNWVEENYSIQPKIYLIGFSMGGLPTLNFTTTYPDLVSKVALLAPSIKSSEWDQERTNIIKDIQIQIWHGDKDVNVPYSYSVYYRNKLSGYGKDIPLITLEGKTHFDVDTEYMEDILLFFSE